MSHVENIIDHNPEGEWQPKIVGFLCRWCSYAGADLAGTGRMKQPASVRIIRVPCSARMNPQFVIRAFNRGADAVLVAGCHPGDCHYTSGNFFTRRRMKLVEGFLRFMGLEPQRFMLRWISASEAQQFADTVAEFTETVRAMGPNRRMREVKP